MPAPDAMSCDKLAKLIATPKAPVVLDVRRAALRDQDPRRLATASCLAEEAMTPAGLSALVPALLPQLSGRTVVVVCAEGHGRSQGVAAWLRAMGIAAEYLEGGHAAWVGVSSCGLLPRWCP